MKMLSKVLTFIASILVTTYAILNGPVKDCTVSHRMWEISLEDFDAYCRPKFCSCFSPSGCAPEWSADIVDGFAMMWLFTNRDGKASISCRGLNFQLYTASDKQFLLMKHYYDYFVLNKRIWGNRWMITPGTAFKAKVNAKTLLDFKIGETEIFRGFPSLKNPPYVGIDLAQISFFKQFNRYPATFLVNVAELDESKKPTNMLGSLIFGPFGGLDNTYTSGFYRFNRYFDGNLGSDSLRLGFTIETIELEEDYRTTTYRNENFEAMLEMWQYMCFGRKINPKTNRTHWVAEGCRPVPYYDNPISSRYLGAYTISCKCDFDSLGFNAPDDDPNAKQVDGFGMEDMAHSSVGESEASNDLLTSVYLSSIGLAVCLLLIIISAGVLVHLFMSSK